MKKKDAIELMYEDGCKLGDLSEDLRKDSEVVMAAVQNCGAALEHADKSLQDDRDIVCLLYTSPSPRDVSRSRMPSSA